MVRLSTATLLAAMVLAACTPKQMTYAQANAICQDKADAAAGPQGSVGLSVGTGGTSASFGLTISDSFLRGDDPKVVYDTCMNNFYANGQIAGAAQ